MPIYTNDPCDDGLFPVEPSLRSSIGIGPKVTKAIDEATRDWLDDHPEATTTVEDNSLTNAKFMDGSVNSRVIENGSIATNDIADLAVTTPKIADNAVTADKIASSAADGLRTMSPTQPGVAKVGAGLAMNDGALELDGSGDIATAVAAWLDAHPEATTTVQDNSITDSKLVQTGGVLSVLTSTRALVEDDDFTFQNGWYKTDGNFYSHVMYRTCVVPVHSNAKMVVTTAANSAAPIAVYFSGEPSSATVLGFEHADYPADYETAQFTDVELTIPAGTKYVAVNKSLNGGFVPEFSIVLADSAMRLANIEDELGKCVSDTEDITETLTIERTLVGGVDYNVSVGYYGNNAELNPNPSFVNTVIEYEAGNKYIVSTYANSAAKIAVFYSGTPSSATFVGAQSADYLPDYALTQFVDFELVVPDGTSKIAINCNINGYLAIKVEGIEQRFIALENEVNELQEANALHKGKKILYMGDSITALGNGTRGWPGMFHTIVDGDTYVNVAVSGARWCDYSDTVLDGNPVFGGEDDNHNNTISNQVEKIVRGKDESDPNYSKVDEYEDFDAIIIAAGTNDVNTDDGLGTQFVVGGVPVMLDDLDRMTWGGAMRYAYERLRNLYPSAAFFYCSPIQGAETTRPYSVITEKRERMRDICDRISDVTFVDTFNCGVCGVYELANTEGRDLIDGLHPLATGAMKIAKYNANAFINFYNFDRS